MLFMFLLMQLQAFATAQRPDQIIWQGKTYMLATNPLEQYKSVDRLRALINREGQFSTACWRGYLAQWRITDGRLYLEGLLNCSNDAPLQGWKRLMGHSGSGPVPASWFSGDLWLMDGRVLAYMQEGYETIYEREIRIRIQNGRVMATETLDNTKTIRTGIANGPGELERFFYEHAHSGLLAAAKSAPGRITFHIRPDSLGRPDSIAILHNDYPAYETWILQTLRRIPEWDVYYRHGRFVPMSHMRSIRLSEAQYRSFKKKR